MTNISQKEIEALKQASMQMQTVVDTTVAEPVDLWQQRISPQAFPGMTVVADQFARSATGLLTRYLERHCTVTALPVMVLESTSLALRDEHAQWHICKQPPLIGESLIFIDSRGSAQLVDLMMGGSGRIGDSWKRRSPTMLEQRLLGKFILALLEPLQSAWQAVQLLSFRYSRACEAFELPQIIDSYEKVVEYGIAVAVGQARFEIHCVVPYSVISPIREKLQRSWGMAAESGEGATDERIAAQLYQATVELRVLLGTGSTSARALQQLAVGEIVLLDTAAASDALVLVEGVRKFSGKLGVSAGHLAVEIKQPLK